MGLGHLLRQPRWIVATVIIVVLSVVFVSLGQWQLRRLDEVKDQNRVVAARTALPPLSYEDLPSDLGPDDVEELAFRSVAVTGEYVTDDELLQRSRVYRTQNGFHVLTPLRTADGTAVLVRRGWVPYELDDPPVAEAAPPTGEVTVVGFLQTSEDQRSIGPTDPTEGPLELVFRADIPRIDEQVDAPLFPMVLALQEQQPAQDGRLPIPTERPDLDEGNHLSYALQWFSFAAIAVIGYAAVLWKRSREPAEDVPGADDRISPRA